MIHKTVASFLRFNAPLAELATDVEAKNGTELALMTI